MATTTTALWKNIKRAQTFPDSGPEIPDWFQRFVKQQYFQLASQVNAMATGIQAMTVTALGVGAATAAVVLPVPYPDTNYTITMTPNWGTTIFVTAQTATGFTANFGTVTPGAANFFYVQTIR